MDKRTLKKMGLIAAMGFGMVALTACYGPPNSPVYEWNFTGRVVDAQGNGMSGVEVTVMIGTSSASKTTTDANGYFRVEENRMHFQSMELVAHIRKDQEVKTVAVDVDTLKDYTQKACARERYQCTALHYENIEIVYKEDDKEE